MIEVKAKTSVHEQLQWVREALVWKLDGLSGYDVPRPLTATGTDLLGRSSTWPPG